jgi:hypothetical protein
MAMAILLWLSINVLSCFIMGFMIFWLSEVTLINGIAATMAAHIATDLWLQARSCSGEDYLEMTVSEKRKMLMELGVVVAVVMATAIGAPGLVTAGLFTALLIVLALPSYSRNEVSSF